MESSSVFEWFGHILVDVLGSLALLLSVYVIVKLWSNRRAMAQAERALPELKRTTVRALERQQPGALVELEGTVRCATPLTSPFTGTPCVYYAVTIEKLKPGYRSARREVAFSEERSVPFKLEDETGRVRIDPAGAQFYPDTLLEKKEPGESLFEILRIRREAAVPVGARVYVIGVLQEDRSIGSAHTDGGATPFVIGTGSETDVHRKIKREKRGTWVNIVGITLLFLLVAWGVFQDCTALFGRWVVVVGGGLGHSTKPVGGGRLYATAWVGGCVTIGRGRRGVLRSTGAGRVPSVSLSGDAPLPCAVRGVVKRVSAGWAACVVGESRR